MTRLLMLLLLATASALNLPSQARTTQPRASVVLSTDRVLAAQSASANYYSSFMHFCDERGDTVRQQHEHHLRAYAEQRRTEIRTRTVTPTPVPQVTVSY